MAVYQKEIEENDKIDSRLKTIVHECFDTLYATLSRNDFLRWVNHSKIDKKIKELVINVMSEDEMKRHNNWAGFYSLKDNRIAVGKKFTRSKGTITHEIDHFLSGDSRFCTYINEGLTEYIKSLAQPVTSETKVYENHDTYIENVRTVKWLHKILGDSFIKYYFVGKDANFDQKFSELAGCDVTEVRNFYDALDRRHEALYEDTDKKSDSEKNKKDEKLIVNMLANIALGRIRQLAKNYSFYQDGKISSELINNALNSIFEGFPFVIDDELLERIRREFLGIIADESHFLVDYQGKEREAKRNEFIETRKLSVFEKDNSDIVSKLLQKDLEGKKGIDFNQFIDIILNILEKFDISERERNSLISESVIRVFGGNIDIRLIDEFIKSNMDRIRNLNKISESRTRNVIESSFRKIGDDKTDTFIEKRDNKFYLVRMQNDGQMLEIGLPLSMREKTVRDSNGWNILGVSKIGSVQSKEVYCIRDLNIKFTLGDKLENITIVEGGDNSENLGIMSLQEFIQYERVNPFFERIRSHRYFDIQNDAQDPTYGVKGIAFVGPGEVDSRSRILQIDSLREDLSILDDLYPDVKRRTDIKKNIIKSVIRRTYGVDERDSDSTEFAFDAINKVILDNDLPEASRRSLFADAMGVLNHLLKERVEENLKYTAIQFKNDEAKKEYFKVKEDIEKEKIRQANIKARQTKRDERRKFEDAKRKVRHTAYYEIIEDQAYEEEGKYTDRMTAFGISGTYFIGTKLGLPGKRKILVDRFIEDVKLITSKMNDESEIKEFIEDCARGTIVAAYQTTRDEIEEPELQEQFDFMVQSLIDKTVEDKEIDEEKFEQANTVLNNHRMAKTRKTRTGAIGFKTKTSERLYSQLCELQEKLSESDFVLVSKTLVNDYNRDYKGEKDGHAKQE